MKIGVYSDLHFENHQDYGASIINEMPDDLDVMVMAGDIESPSNIHHVFKIACDKFKHVVYAIGNHDVWESSFGELRAILKTMSDTFPNLHVLDNRVDVIDGIRFVGATMFFANQPDNIKYEKYIVDFFLVKNYREEVYKENAAAQQFLYDNVETGDIVVTHHMPHNNSVHPMYYGDKLNRFFVCDMNDLIVSKKPLLWIHGHTHFSFDYMVGDTRIVCNPFGYVNALNRQYEAAKVIDVE